MLIPLTEYAERRGRAERSVRQMAQAGRFKTAQKVGRDWLIDENEPYPARINLREPKEKKKSTGKQRGGAYFNPDTASMVAVRTVNQYDWLNRVHEELFRTPSGKYFLYGEGGPNTEYAERSGRNEWAPGKKLSLLTEEQAKSWVDEHLPPKEYKKIFGEVDGPAEP